MIYRHCVEIGKQGVWMNIVVMSDPLPNLSKVFIFEVLEQFFVFFSKRSQFVQFYEDLRGVR